MPKNEEEMNPALSVIIPAYNEGQRIHKTLSAVYDYLRAKPFTWELLIVLDGCTDDTEAVIAAFAAEKEHIRWINRPQNRGKGYTVREGMLAARGDIRLFTDADNSTDMSHYDQMEPLFDQGAAVVIASRDNKDVPFAKQVTPQPLHKRFLGNVGNLFIQVLAVPGIWDTQCGFKALRANAAKQIFSVAQINGWLFDIELLALARSFGHEIQIIGANWVDEPHTHVTFSGYLLSLLEAFKVRWNLLSGAYKRWDMQEREHARTELKQNI